MDFSSPTCISNFNFKLHVKLEKLSYCLRSDVWETETRRGLEMYIGIPVRIDVKKNVYCPVQSIRRTRAAEILCLADTSSVSYRLQWNYASTYRLSSLRRPVRRRGR